MCHHPQDFDRFDTAAYIRTRFKIASGVKGRCELSKLPYWDIAKNHIIDYMHTSKNVFERITRSLMAEDFNYKPGVREYMKSVSCMKRNVPVPPAEVSVCSIVLFPLVSLCFVAFHYVSPGFRSSC